MELSTEWFGLSESKNDLENVLDFVEQLPLKFQQIFDIDKSNFISHYIEKDRDYGITPVLFLDTFNEAKRELELSLQFFRRNLNLDSLIGDNTSGREAGEILLQIAFSGQSLKLKSAILNKLWSKIRIQVENFGGGIIDFANNPIVKLFRKFLQYLNSILDSLKELIPGIDALKEFKEIIESYLAIADED